MKGACFALLVAMCWTDGQAVEHGTDSFHFEDVAWARAAADELARCAGTYRGAAQVLRDGERVEGAAYLDGVASGALFAAYVLLTSPAAIESKVLGAVNTQVYLAALADGAEVNFNRLAERPATTAAMSDALQLCTRTSVLQSSVLRTLMPTAAPAGAANVRTQPP
jgi:hypothetical protein